MRKRMVPMDKQPVVYTGDLDERLGFVSDSQSVAEILDLIGAPVEVRERVRSLLVSSAMGDLSQVWGCERLVPTDASRWFDLLGDEEVL